MSCRYDSTEKESPKSKMDKGLWERVKIKYYFLKSNSEKLYLK